MLHIVRGQITQLPPGCLPQIQRVIAREGYVAAGYASRGVVWAGLLGEALTDLMTQQPLPLEAELMQAIAPERFTRP